MRVPDPLLAACWSRLPGGPRPARTATVTTEVDTRLLVVPRVGFLAAVTGSVDGRLVAEKVAAAHLARDAA